MELYEAKFDYEKERDDVLSFRKGDQFEITHKPDSKWWAAKRVSDNAMGYVPALYLQHTKDRVVGRLIPEDIRKSQEHNIHLQALLELQRKVKPIPAHVVKAALGATNQLTNQKGDALSNEDDNDEENAKDGVPYHHKCNVNTSDYQYTDKMDDINITPYHHQCIAADAVIDDGSDDSDLPFHLKFPPPDEAPPTPDYDLEDYQFDDMTPFHHKYHINAEDSFPFPPDEEDVEIRPKPLPNPVLQSKKHQELHRELKLISKTNPKGFDKPELTKAFAARKSEEEKQTTIVEDNQPEFMKLKLRHRSDSQGSNNS
uniref:Uncharacterized protein LOC100368964 n=1 Tax=Saccoglossus kowalevskii TaxID=10224 RepID=A0ABM0N0C6_SACKO|nr:PREDICTED: uncharacterized protein LOC100368964 [Saccoglossus kowalevskii]